MFTEVEIESIIAAIKERLKNYEFSEDFFKVRSTENRDGEDSDQLKYLEKEAKDAADADRLLLAKLELMKSPSAPKSLQPCAPCQQRCRQHIKF